MTSKLSSISSKKKIYARTVWGVVWCLITIPFPRSSVRLFKIHVLRLFGAQIHTTANIYSSARIYAPWNLEMKEFACLAPEVDCYNVDKVTIGAKSTVSQKTYLCTASHDISDSEHTPLITSPIVIENNVWVGAAAYIGMGVKIGEGAVVGATSSVYKNVEPYTVVGGNPSKLLKKRIINE